MHSDPIHVALSEDDFRKLVAGKVVEVDSIPRVRIILSDIGWVNIIVAVSDAMKEAKVYPQPGEPWKPSN
jgi:hypothetical protein